MGLGEEDLFFLLSLPQLTNNRCSWGTSSNRIDGSMSIY
jgi:hypothetical protein